MTTLEAVLDILADARREHGDTLDARAWGDVAEKLAVVFDAAVRATVKEANNAAWNAHRIGDVCAKLVAPGVRCSSRVRTPVAGRLLCVACGTPDRRDAASRAAKTRAKRTGRDRERSNVSHAMTQIDFGTVDVRKVP